MIYPTIRKDAETNTKKLAVLIDPDKTDPENLIQLADFLKKFKADYLFVGGSLMMCNFLGESIRILKSSIDIPIIIFPGSSMQIDGQADGLLLLSLISGRNPELLIGNHVTAAPHLKESGLEIIPTGYMLIESGKTTSVVYMSNTNPIPADKNDIAICTAMAGEMLGLKAIYMDAGSGALNPVPASMIKNVKANIDIPLIVGGGIRSPEAALNAWNSGADMIVIGNALESEMNIIKDICLMRDKINNVVV